MKRSILRSLVAGVTLAVGIAGAAPAFAAESTADVVVITGATIHVGDGTVIESGTVVVEDGAIVAVGRGVSVPRGAQTVEADGLHVTPGLIDANARIEARDVVTTQPQRRQGASIAGLFHTHDLDEACSCSGLAVCALAEGHADLEGEAICPICGWPGPPGVHDLISGVRAGGSFTKTESSSEIVPHTWVADAVNLRSPDFQRLAGQGVTTVFAAPDNAAVIGPRGAIVKTGGPMRERFVLEAGDVHAVISPDTYRVGGGNASPFRNFVSNRTRRPGSRMGVAWVFRKAMYDSINRAAGHEVGGADTPPDDAFPVLDEIRSGEIDLRIASRTQRDIETAFRLADEFELEFTLTEGWAAHMMLDRIKETGTSVIFGPIVMTGNGERREASFDTVVQLIDAGVPTAISARDLRDEDGLARQAMYAMRAGLDREAAIEAVTLTPARMLGIDETHGSVATGKSGDLVIWSGTPLDATSRPLVVMVAGETVVDRRDD